MSELRRFVIVGTQRTGTTLIRTSLSSHPGICCHGEVFKLGAKPYTHAGGYWEFSRRSPMLRARAFVSPRRSVAAYLDQMYDERGFDAVGFKLMLSHCVSRPYIWPLVLQRGALVVWVRRRNQLRTLVSRRAAEESGVYHVSRTLKSDAAVGAWSARKINLRETTLIDDLEKIEEEDNSWRARLAGHTSYYEIVYEDYVKAIPAGNIRLLSFLGMRNCDLKSDLRKVNPTDLHDVIENIDKVREILTGSRFASMLQDD